MKTAEYKSLGLKVVLNVPATVDEFDKNAKREGACLSEATSNIVYRTCLAELRDLFLHGRAEDKENKIAAFDGIEQVTKIERKTKPTGRKTEGGEDVLTYDESEADYFARVCATKKVEASSFQPLMDKAAALIEFDASARERKPAAPKKLAAKYKETAAMILKGQGLPRFLKDIKAALGKDWVKTGDAEKDSESLGWLVKEFVAYKEEQQLKSMAG